MAPLSPYYIIITLNETHLWGELDGNYAGSLLEREDKWDDVSSSIVVLIKAFSNRIVDQNKPAQNKNIGRDNKNK